MGKNEIYMRDRMVEDPIAHVRFPDLAAGASLEWQGQKFYVIGEQTRRSSRSNRDRVEVSRPLQENVHEDRPDRRE
jgi:hypothetical protein